ncbi:NAD(P)-binding protein [Aspergillus aculeatinus CBS 121060]|uniref:NAD(P)-binding protein n=1 Tax=Aspergillus aculeatinus CBS 121060 TaxID=1448322 RepID=A0ACD1GYZ3_9EURO|nr:NAD(P)-binding protein [Aspergillus aculeatinus CBS 121060]RAH66348.1 NAD(P)-binding protein [Aspergillus aculeatinus CBS 121060]
MPYNRIAIYGHRGWASSAIVHALASSGAPIRVLYRPGSDISTLPGNVRAVEVDVSDEAAVVAALEEIDIVISLVGHEGVPRQHHLINAIPKTAVQLFVPSELAARYDAQGLRIPVNQAKKAVELAAQAAGIPMTIVLVGNFAEFALATPAMGVDYPNNRIIFTGDSATHAVNLCTRAYVAAAYASIFAATPLDQLKTRTLTLSELRATGDEIAAALTERHGTRTLSATGTIDAVDAQIEGFLQAGKPFGLAFYCRRIWGAGMQVGMLTEDVWEVPGYVKAGLGELVVGGGLGAYRTLPQEVWGVFEEGFAACA